MIYDKAENLSLYEGVHPDMPAVAAFIRAFLAAPGADGRYEIPGAEAYANVFENPTGPDEEKRYETHDRYIDLQLILSGGQTISVADRDALVPSAPYDAQKDITFYPASGDGRAFGLTPGQFLFLFPSDAHRPDCRLAGYERARKMVVKIPVRSGK